MLTTEKRVAVISALVEGCSIRSTVRMTGVAKDTVLKLLAKVGEACLEYQDQVLRNLPCKRIECDEIWCFCYAKDKNLPDDMRGMPGVGSIWTWTAIVRRYEADGYRGGLARATRRTLTPSWRRSRAAREPRATDDRRQPGLPRTRSRTTSAARSTTPC